MLSVLDPATELRVAWIVGKLAVPSSIELINKESCCSPLTRRRTRPPPHVDSVLSIEEFSPASGLKPLVLPSEENSH